MSTCPYCGLELKIDTSVSRNVLSYGKPVLIRSPCCHKPLTVYPINIVGLAPSLRSESGEDDWGDTYYPASFEDVINHELQYL